MCCFLTPRIVMQRCLAAIATPTPSVRVHPKSLQQFALSKDPAPVLSEQIFPPGEELYSVQSLFRTRYSDVHLAEERQNVVFAQTKDLNVLDDYHLVVSYIEQRTQQNLLSVSW